MRRLPFCGCRVSPPEQRLFILRLFVYLGLVALVASLAMFLLRRDARYLRFAWQLLKFSVVFMVVFGVLLMMGRLILGAL